MEPQDTIFLKGRDIVDPTEQAAYLAQACGNDADLRQRVEAMLRDAAEADAFFGPEPVRATATEGPGTVIGRYRLLQKIGEGGMGVVYMAEQREPVVRKVALKIVKLGMDTRQVVARFEAERQALALMDHPNIAKVLDGGATGSGRPYFVMELVPGLPITQFCDDANLATRERLELFLEVCSAVQHAHQKGIIHRDLKPSNILVTLHGDKPVPKVIDFGVAKATAGRLTEKTLFTQFQQFIGTPAYMSPEQASLSGLDVDTRSDIYGLGVLLYELLTGRTPFDGKELLKAGLDEMRRTIRETEPARPSTRISTLLGEDLTTTALRRRTDPPKLVHLVRGDLDWIVMKALEKDRARRYETANALAVDIKRHLANEPIMARPPSRGYRFQKLVRRNKLAFGAAAILAAVMLVATAVSTWQAVRATQATREALAAQAQALAAVHEQSRLWSVAQKELYGSLLGQARATRLARGMGYRMRVFALLQQAQTLAVPGKNPADLRFEAAACLGDFIGLVPATLTNFPTDVQIKRSCLDPSGKLAAFALSDGTMQLRDLPSGKELARFNGASGEFSDACFNSAGDQLFAVWVSTAPDWSQSLSSRQLYSWTCNADGRWHETWNRPLPGAIALLNNGTEMLAVVAELGPLISSNSESYDAKFKLYNLRTGTFAAGYEATNVLNAQFDLEIQTTPDGRLIAVETGDTPNPNSSVTVNIYDWKSSQRVSQLHLPKFARLSLNQGGNYLACLSRAGGGIYTVPSLERIAQFKEYFEARAVFSGNVAALPITQQHRIRLWSLASREDIALLDEPDFAVPAAFSADGSCLLTAGLYHARLYQLAMPERLELHAHAAAVTGLAFSPDGTRLASVGKDRVVRVCDATTSFTIWEADGLPGPGQCVAYSPDGQWLVTGDFDTDRVWIWNSETGKRVLEFGANGAGPTWSAQFSPDGRCLATAGADGIRIYQIQRPLSGDDNGGLEVKLIRLVSSPSLIGAPRNLAFAPDGRTLAFEHCKMRDLFLLDLDQQTPLRDMGFELLNCVGTKNFATDGHHLHVLDDGGKIVTLELPKGNKVSSFQVVSSTGSTSFGIRMSPDGSKFAVGSESGLGVDIWDAATDTLLYSQPDEAGTVYWLAWSPDSRRLAIARDNGRLSVWNLDTVGKILAKLGLNP